MAGVVLVDLIALNGLLAKACMVRIRIGRNEFLELWADLKEHFVLLVGDQLLLTHPLFSWTSLLVLVLQIYQ